MATAGEVRPLVLEEDGTNSSGIPISKRYGSVALLILVGAALLLVAASASGLLSRTLGIGNVSPGKEETNFLELFGATVTEVGGAAKPEKNKEIRNRYAIAYVFSDPTNFRADHGIDSSNDFTGPYANDQGVCALAVSVAKSRKLLQDAMGEGAVVDAVVLTDNMRMEHATWVKKLGIRVFKTNVTSLYTPELYKGKSLSKYVKDAKSTESDAFYKMRAASLKVGLTALTEYRRLVFLDVDALVTDPPAQGIFEKNEDGWDAELVTFSCCPYSPWSAGMFFLKPTMTAFLDMQDLLRGGFSHERGWLKRPSKVGTWEKMKCKPWFLPYVKALCKDSDSPRWDFIGAESDQGIFFAEYAQHRRSMSQIEDIKSAFPFTNFAGPHKPWSHQNGCRYRQKYNNQGRFWEAWKEYGRPAMEKLQDDHLALKCISMFDPVEKMPFFEGRGTHINKDSCHAGGVSI